jgi:hypothetical protein
VRAAGATVGKAPEKVSLALPPAKVIPVAVANERAIPALSSSAPAVSPQSRPQVEKSLHRSPLVREKQPVARGKEVPTNPPASTEIPTSVAPTVADDSSAAADPLGTHRAGPLTREEF